jgi:hypothetical protein
MLIGLPGEIQPSGNGLLASLPASHATVNQLEEIPVLKAENVKLEANSAQKDVTLSQAQKTLGSTAAELETCKKTVMDSAKLCDAKVAEVKASGRKRNIVVAVLAAIGGFLLKSKI